MMDTLLSLLPYAAMVGAFVLSLLELIAEAKKPWKKTKLSLYFFLAAIGVVSLNYDRGEKAKEQAEQKGQVDAGLARIDKLQETLTRMETSNATRSLEKELATVKLQLLKTQKAMAPGPKAKLVFTLVPYEKPVRGKLLEPVTTIKRVVDENGKIHITMSGMNITETDATGLQLILDICKECKYASEPTGFSKVVGASDTQRNLTMSNFSAMLLLEEFSFDIIVPPNFVSIPISMHYRCKDCTFELEPQILTVKILHSGAPLQE